MIMTTYLKVIKINNGYFKQILHTFLFVFAFDFGEECFFGDDLVMEGGFFLTEDTFLGVVLRVEGRRNSPCLEKCYD